MKIDGFCFGAGFVLGLIMLWNLQQENIILAIISMALSLLNFSLAFKNE